MTKEQLKSIIEDAFTNCQTNIESDDNVHFNATIIADEFNEVKNRVKRQQLVYSKINEHILSGEVHAISMKVLGNNEI